MHAEPIRERDSETLRAGLWSSNTGGDLEAPPFRIAIWPLAFTLDFACDAEAVRGRAEELEAEDESDESAEEE